MRPVNYRFVTNWNVRGTVEEVYEILSDPLGFVRWWPTVYLDVSEIKAGAENGLGRVVKLRTKGRLPYELNWVAESTAVNKPFGMTVKASGDLEGEGNWAFQQLDGDVNISYDWRVITRRAWMNIMSPVLRPIFRMNHEWAMNEGEKGLRIELAKRADNNSIAI